MIPAFNEALLIRRAVESVVAAGIAPHDIYVIDDGSSDQTEAEAQALGTNTLRNPVNIGKAASVTRAIAYFRLLKRYTHVSFLDADTILDPEYFRFVKRRFKSGPRIAAVCGHPKSTPRNWLTAHRAFLYFIADVIFKPVQSAIGAIMVVPGCAATYTISALECMEWTGDTLTEDMDVTIQAALKSGGRIVYESRAIVYTQDPETLRDYIGQVSRWQCGAWQVIRKHKLFTRGMRSIHWECRFLFAEAVIVSLYAALIPLFAILWPKLILRGGVAWFAIFGLVAAYAAYRERRTDILRAAIFYPPLWFLDNMLFLWSCVTALKGRSDIKHSWFRPKRYSIEKPNKKRRKGNDD